MELLLFVITGSALLLALAMGIVLWSVVRDERARSDARIELLLQAAGEPPLPGDAADPDPDPTSDVDDGGGTGLFAPGLAASSWNPGTAVILTGALSGAAAVLLALTLATSWSPAPSDAAAEVRPLELLMLSHLQAPDGLTISGTVHNPRGGARRGGLLVVASALDAAGREIGSSRSALDHAVLDPGGESSFVVNVAVSGSATRYRVGFRDADGAVIAHLDRRSDDVSRTDSTTGGGPWVP